MGQGLSAANVVTDDMYLAQDAKCNQENFFGLLTDTLAGIKAVASEDQLAGIICGARMVLGAIEDLDFELINRKDQTPLNPKHEYMDFDLVVAWDNYVSEINT
ncbi:hypothetical protein MZD04_gp351 [Pseudomonas phage Psa21]|uniref:Uncharacterized protein n=1 Tax=Pseudomonas phage Psa21 TaxID=2530023 RepID=A0A481W6N2_9CAUD|nr:hypothetical protein MZD04_gp351 [Pseudomonas phage Psa21]QBJ02877.1 hypothetical protein PSA21_351 [Pseudomonas phage Psa21]